MHDLNTAPETARNTLAPLQNRYGRILDIHGEMAHARVVLGDSGIHAAIAEHGTFDARTRARATRAAAIVMSVLAGLPALHLMAKSMTWDGSSPATAFH